MDLSSLEKELIDIIDVPWNLSVGSNLMCPSVERKRTPAICFFTGK